MNTVFFSPSRIVTIGRNTFTELVRQKVFYFLLIFALIVIGNSAFLAKFSFQEEFQMLKDVALGAMSVFLCLLAILATAMLLPRDLEDRTIFTILSKPVPRYEYLLGKLFGVVILLTLSTLIMGVLFLGVLLLREQNALMETHRSLSGSPQELAAAITEIKKAAGPEYSLINALSSALNLENGLLEQKYFEVFDTYSPEVKNVFTELAEDTKRHAAKVRELWQKNRKL